MTKSLSIAVATLALTACTGGGDKPAAPATSSAAAKPGAAASAAAPATVAAPAGPNMVTLTKLNLKAEAPEGTTAGDGIVGDGVMLQGPDLVATVEVASATRPKTLDEAKKEADMYSPKNMAGEALPDGFWMTFDNEGGMGKNYFVNVRRTIAGKDIWCETTASKPEQQANALKACKSLKP